MAILEGIQIQNFRALRNIELGKTFDNKNKALPRLIAIIGANGSIDEAFVKELAKHRPLRVVFRDADYKNSAVKINVGKIFKLLPPATEVKCI